MKKNHDHHHDEKTCFRCRLHKLFEELKGNNEIEFILMSLAEASGSILAHSDLKMFAKFFGEVRDTYQFELISNKLLEDAKDEADEDDKKGSTTTH